ncbi:hypothetical protein CA54_00050 [Symmachiella macrocystis]|uniref:Uncharacterized protein n=1 Tax=Symmachiella macrocystis TaxID=2527985 RepID=A0A5C6BHK3_9PLAN|nr:hypothetical protein [Symmachiella macrocystis]TWU11202.1 hypothetical protein CA54_00050 [Symmachiella macrocystis]
MGWLKSLDCRVFFSVVLIGLWTAQQACHAKDDDWVDQLKVRLQAAKKDGDVDVFYREYFSTASDTHVEVLTTCSDDGLALQASWEQLLRSVPHLLAKRPETKKLKLSRIQLARFLGFTNGRLKVNIPTWWDAQLSQMTAIKVNTRVTPYIFGLSFNGNEEHNPYHTTGIGLDAPKEIEIVFGSKNQLELSVDGDLFEVPSWLIDKDRVQNREVESITALLTDQYCYLAMPEYGNGSGSYTMWCVRRTDGSKMWSTEVGGPSWGGYTIGGPTRVPHHVTIVLNRGSVLLFGGDMDSMYIEAFAAEDGKLQFRFCTLD